MPGWVGSAASTPVEVEQGQRRPCLRVVAVRARSWSRPRSRRAARRGCCCPPWRARWRLRQTMAVPDPASAAARAAATASSKRSAQASATARRPSRSACRLSFGREQVVGDLQEHRLLVMRPGRPRPFGSLERRYDARLRAGQRCRVVVLGRDLPRTDPGALCARGGGRHRKIAVQPQPSRRVQLLVNGVPDQRMSEVVAVRDGVRHEELGLQGLVERGQAPSAPTGRPPCRTGSNRNGPSTAAATSNRRLVNPTSRRRLRRSRGERPRAPPTAAAGPATARRVPRRSAPSSRRWRTTSRTKKGLPWVSA